MIDLEIIILSEVSETEEDELHMMSLICGIKKIRYKGTYLQSRNRLTFVENKSWFSSVQFIRSVVSDSLPPHELQCARPPCPSQTPGVYPNPCPSSRWCHPAISSSAVPFSSCPQSLPASGSFPKRQLFTWGGQSAGVSASASVLPVTLRTDFL